MNVIIDNSHDLLERIDEYKHIFPDTYTDMTRIKEVLETNYNAPVGHVFGVEISKEWQDKCFGFEVCKVTPDATYFRYIGVWKC